MNADVWILLRSTLLLAALVGTPRIVAAQADDTCYITNIDFFVEQCPTLDPAIDEILTDFRITRDGVDIADVNCEEPISSLPIEEYTDELILLQGLRIIYYMDKGQSEHLPWTDLSLYEWLKSKVGGINIDSSITSGWCCGVWPDGTVYFTVGTADESNRNYDRTWPWLGHNIAFYMHEARHADGYPHVGCCSVGGYGCDLVYDESSLSPYGIQWWLNRAWLDGALNTGYGCLGEPRKTEIRWSHLGSVNSFRDRFCESPPPIVDQTIIAPCSDCQRPPVIFALDDGPFVVQEGGALVDTSSVLDNDTASGNLPLTAVIIESPAYASFFELRSDGTFDYTHDGSETTVDIFTYKATDGVDESDVASVSLEIAPVNDMPTITLGGDITITLEQGDVFSDPGATALDAEDGDISTDIVVGGDSVDTSAQGTYTVSYNVTDSAGSAATEVTRTVTITAPAPPAPPAPPASQSSGGGSFGVPSLLFLLGFAACRRKLREC